MGNAKPSSCALRYVPKRNARSDLMSLSEPNELQALHKSLLTDALPCLQLRPVTSSRHHSETIQPSPSLPSSPNSSLSATFISLPRIYTCPGGQVPEQNPPSRVLNSTDVHISISAEARHMGSSKGSESRQAQVYAVTMETPAVVRE